MLDRATAGDVPRKHHIALRGADGALRYEECFTRAGFDGAFSILYHLAPIQTHQPAAIAHGWTPAAPHRERLPLAKRHYKTPALAGRGGAQVDARVALLHGRDVALGVVHPDQPDPVYVVNGDADELLYIHQGGGTVISPFGDLVFRQGDYVCIPGGVIHRIVPSDGPQAWLWIEAHDLHLLKQWRNDVGQLRMDAPYCHRDFRRPEFTGPRDEQLRELVVKRGDAWHGFTLKSSPLDVVGWDGAVYPWAFPILAFQPRVSSVHLPPTWHGTFGARGTLVCSFVPRLVDFHPEAIPCPYPHSAPDCDEVLFYCDGNFTSRRGVGPGSISFHPAGIPHGPHPGSYERSIGTTRTDELAVMMDTFAPLTPTTAALEIEDAGYMQSFID